MDFIGSTFPDPGNSLLAGVAGLRPVADRPVLEAGVPWSAGDLHDRFRPHCGRSMIGDEDDESGPCRSLFILNHFCRRFRDFCDKLQIALQLGWLKAENTNLSRHVLLSANPFDKILVLMPRGYAISGRHHSNPTRGDSTCDDFF